MKVKDVMTSDVVTVDADSPLKDAARTLVEYHITGVPVLDLSGAVVGMLSEADIVAKQAGQEPQRKRGALAWLLDPVDPWLNERSAARIVGEAMSAPAITIGPDAELSAAASRMIEDGVNRLPVLDEDGGLVGIVTRADLVRAFTRSDDEIAREISHDIVERIFWLDPADVQVSVSHGVVTLAGKVETESDVKLLPELVRRAPGVVSVNSALTAR